MPLFLDIDPRRGSSRTALTVALGVMLLAMLALPFVFRPLVVKEEANLPVRKLVIISPHWEGVRIEFERAFSAYTARKLGHRTQIEWLDLGGTSDAVRYVKSEFERSPQGIKIDLFFGGGVDPYMNFAKADLLEPCKLPDKVIKDIPQQYSGMEIYDAQGRWFGACLAGFGILYNKKVLADLRLPEPRTWEDMGRPEYFTRVGSGDPRSSGSIHMVYEVIAQAYGWDKGWAAIVRMAGNIRNFSRAASDVPKDCALGEIAMGMAIDVYARRQIAEVGEDRMGFTMPEKLTAVNPDAIGMLKGAPNRDLALKFIEFVLSEPGQKLWLFKRGTPGGPEKFELGRMSVIPHYAECYPEYASVPGNPYDWIGAFTYDSQKGSARWDILNDLIGACVIDTHDELVAAWKVVSKLPPDNPAVREFVKPPVSEPEMLEMAAKKWSDAEFRTSTVARWVREAKERYSRIARGE